MGAFLPLQKQDVFQTTYTAHKYWTFDQDTFLTAGGKIYRGTKNTGSIYVEGAETGSNGEYTDLVYRGIQQLYFSGNKGSKILSGSFETYPQSSLISSSYEIKNSLAVISIPQQVYGEYIKPGSFSFSATFTEDGDYYSGSYVISDYVLQSGSAFSSSITEDSEGYLYTEDGKTAGLINYRHGLIIFNDSSFIGEQTDIVHYLTRDSYDREYTLSFKGTYEIITQNVHCIVKNHECNFTFNPTALSGSQGDLKNNITGSYFSPFVTSIGLYNEASELLAVAKLSQPLPKSKEIDTTFKITLDL